MSRSIDWMVECFARGDYVVTEDNYAQFQEELIENTKNCRDGNSDLFR